MRILTAMTAVLMVSCSTVGTGFLGTSGKIGPIAVSSDGRSTVALEAEAVKGEPPACVKPVKIEFAAPDWSAACAAEIPVPPNAAGLCQ
jgi:hypothetical protein